MDYSYALISGMTSLALRFGCWSGSTIWWSGSGRWRGISQGRPLNSLTCEVALVLGRPSDWPDCAASANPFLSFLRPAFLEPN